jgi:hypothetical protein
VRRLVIGQASHDMLPALYCGAMRHEPTGRLEMSRIRGQGRRSANVEESPRLSGGFTRMETGVGAGSTPQASASEFEPAVQAIQNWIAYAEPDRGERPESLSYPGIWRSSSSNGTSFQDL